MRDLSDSLPKEFVEKRKALFEAEQDRSEPTYWDMIAEMQLYGGFEAVKAVLDSYITLEQANALLIASRKLYNQTVYDMGVASLAGNHSKSFNKLMKKYINGMK